MTRDVDWLVNGLVILLLLAACVPAAPPLTGNELQIGTTRHCIETRIQEPLCVNPQTKEQVNGWWYAFKAGEGYEHRICVSRASTNQGGELISNRKYQVYYPEGLDAAGRTFFHEWMHAMIHAAGGDAKFDNNWGLK